MTTDLAVALAHSAGEQSEIEEWSAIADTFGGRVHVEWDAAEPVTPLGQLPFFVEYLKRGGLFDGWVADCPLSFTSPNAPRKRDVLGTLLLSVLAGHQRCGPTFSATASGILTRPSLMHAKTLGTSSSKCLSASLPSPGALGPNRLPDRAAGMRSHKPFSFTWP